MKYKRLVGVFILVLFIAGCGISGKAKENEMPIEEAYGTSDEEVELKDDAVDEETQVIVEKKEAQITVTLIPALTPQNEVTLIPTVTLTPTPVVGEDNETSSTQLTVTYEIVNDEVVITGMNYDNYNSELIIPAMIDGRKVTKIKDGAFRNELVVRVTIPDGMIEIGEYAFSGCGFLTYADLPVSLKTIGNYAFDNCTLLDMEIPEKLIYLGKNAFSGTQCLHHVVIPGTVEHIGERAFYECEYLESVIIQEGVQSIGDYAFGKCVNMGSVTFADSVTSIGEGAFYRCNISELELSEELRYIGPQAFFECGATEIEFSSHITEIGEHAFSGCTWLSKINLPEGLVKIGDGAFEQCRMLQEINVPSTVVSIGNVAFYNCTCLKAIAIPEGVQFIGESAFAFCAGLESVSYIPSSVQAVGENAFGNTPWGSVYGAEGGNEKYPGEVGYVIVDDTEDEIIIVGIPSAYFSEEVVIPDYINGKPVTKIEERAFENNCKFEKIILPETLEIIEDFAFEECENLVEIRFPNTIKEIGESTFSKCKNLVEVSLPEGLTMIEYCLFEECKNLRKVNIPSSVESIFIEAFMGCSSLEEITIPQNVTYIAEDAFASCSTLEKVTIMNDDTEICSGAFYDTPWGETYGSDGRYRFNTVDKFLQYYEKDGGIVITGISDAERFKEVVIPEYIDGLPVVEIAKLAFEENNYLEKITLPGTIVKIGEFAFNDCYNLLEVNLMEGLEKIASTAFSGCDSLVVLDIPSTVATIKGHIGDIEWSFQFETLWIAGQGEFTEDMMKTISAKVEGNIRNIIIDGSVDKIGKEVFSKRYYLDSVEIGSGVKEIGERAFAYCNTLKSIDIPASVEKIGSAAFYECSRLEKVFIRNPAVFIDDTYWDMLEYVGDVVIYGYADSTAEKYAQNYYRDFEMLTD